MRTVNPSILLGLTVASLMLLAGIAVLLGWNTSHFPQQVRITFGIVLLLFGLYRAATTLTNYRGQRHEDS